MYHYMDFLPPPPSGTDYKPSTYEKIVMILEGGKRLPDELFVGDQVETRRTWYGGRIKLARLGSYATDKDGTIDLYVSKSQRLYHDTAAPGWRRFRKIWPFFRSDQEQAQILSLLEKVAIR